MGTLRRYVELWRLSLTAGKQTPPEELAAVCKFLAWHAAVLIGLAAGLAAWYTSR